MWRKTVLIFASLSLIICQASWGAVIHRIEVVGNRSVNQSLIVNMSGLTVGSEIRPGLIQDAVKSIYAMNLFSDIQIQGEEKPEGIDLTIEVKEFPRVKEVQISGNKKIKKDDLNEKIKMSPGKVINPVDLKEAVNGVKSLYDEKGYLSAQVESELIGTDREGEVIVEIKINEGQKVKIKKIYVEGAQAFKPSKVRKQMKNKEDRWWRGGEFKAEQYEEDKEKIVEFYKKEGYLDAQIISDSIWYGPDKKNLFIRIDLNEGERYEFGEVSWEGNQLFTSEQLSRAVKFKTGDVYSQEKYDETLGEIYSFYQEEGYLYVQVEDKTSTRGNVVNIVYGLTEGVPANVNYINVAGNTKTKDKVIRRELSIFPGQRFRRSLLMRSLRDVMYLDYFSNVEPDYEVLDNGDIDLTIRVEEKPTGQFSFGAGYSATDKLVGNIGIGIPNLFGNGQTLKLNWDFGKTTNSIEFSFVEPWFRDTPTSVGFDIYQVNRDWYDYYTVESTGFGLSLGRRLTWPDNYFRTYWRYKWEKLRYYNFDEDELEDNTSYVYLLSQVDWPRRNATVSFTIIRDSRDLPQFPNKGSVLSWKTELGQEVFGGEFCYHKHIFSASYHWNFLAKFVLSGNMKVGLIDGRDRDNAELSGELFTPGGTDPDGIIRGYSDSYLPSDDPNKDRLRGASELIYNLELRYPLVEQQMYLLAFADAGNVWQSGKEIRPFALEHKSEEDLFRSLGLGVRLAIPGMGLVGFDFGYGFDHFNGGEWKPHFQFGTTF
jgi:outer membrane protein insertion porin family